MKGVPSAFMDYTQLFEDPMADERSDEEEEPKKANKSKYP
jgi:hypothetical protein